METRLMVIGCSCSGKSTFSRKLAEITGLPLTHLDRLFWKSGWIEEDRDIFLTKQKSIVRQDKWIIDGHYRSTMEMRLERAQVIYRFRIGTIACLLGYVKRLMEKRHAVRPDITVGCEERIEWDFIKWIAGFSRKQEKRTDEILKKYPHIKVITFYSRRQADKYLDSIRSYKNNNQEIKL